MSTPLPSDFPDMDLEAWRAALPFPEQQPETRYFINGIPARSPYEKLEAPKPEPPLVLGSEVFARKASRFRRKP